MVPEFFHSYMNAQVWLTGSHMYGMATSDSDEDFTGVFHNREEFLNPLTERDFTVTNDTNDYVLHSASKFARLVVKGNFNTLDLVFHEPVKVSQFVNSLCLAMRPHAVTQNAARAYMGYVRSQQGAGLLHPRPQSPTRKAQVEALGYDPKFAAHLMRGMYSLMHMLKYGEYYFLTKDDRRFLTEVKSGEYAKPVLERTVADYMHLLERAYEEKLESLPTTEDLEKLVKEYFVYYA